MEFSRFSGYFVILWWETESQFLRVANLGLPGREQNVSVEPAITCDSQELGAFISFLELSKIFRSGGGVKKNQKNPARRR